MPTSEERRLAYARRIADVVNEGLSEADDKTDALHDASDALGAVLAAVSMLLAGMDPGREQEQIQGLMAAIHDGIGGWMFENQLARLAGKKGGGTG